MTDDKESFHSIKQIGNNEKFMISLIGWNSTEGDYRMCTLGDTPQRLS